MTSNIEQQLDTTNSQHNVPIQQITNELRQWIIDQIIIGIDTPSMIDSLRIAGWNEDTIVQALEDILSTRLDGVPIPEPQLNDFPATIDCGDRTVNVLLTMAKPRIVVFGDLLSPEECDALIDAATPLMKRSLTVAPNTGCEEINDGRTSDGMYFQRGDSPLIQQIEERISRLLNWPIENGEGLQVLHYQPGAEYKTHYDYFDPDGLSTPDIVSCGGQRVGTLVIYLNTPEKGGGTIFPQAQLEVVPQRGNAVFFSYAIPEPSTLTLHCGAPVIAGDKWIATKWLRQREYK